MARLTADPLLNVGAKTSKSLPLLVFLFVAACFEPRYELARPEGKSVIIFDEDHLANGVTVDSLELTLKSKGIKIFKNVVKDYDYIRSNSGLVRVKISQGCYDNEEDFGLILQQSLIGGNFVCYDVVGDNSWAEVWRD